MSASGFQVDTNSLRTAEREVAATTDMLGNAKRSVSADVANTLAAWDGIAASSFDAAFTEWCDGAETVLAALTDMRDALRATCASYGLQDDTSSAALRSSGLNL